MHSEISTSLYALICILNFVDDKKQDARFHTKLNKKIDDKNSSYIYYCLHAIMFYTENQTLGLKLRIFTNKLRTNKKLWVKVVKTRILRVKSGELVTLVAYLTSVRKKP